MLKDLQLGILSQTKVTLFSSQASPLVFCSNILLLETLHFRHQSDLANLKLKQEKSKFWYSWAVDKFISKLMSRLFQVWLWLIIPSDITSQKRVITSLKFHRLFQWINQEFLSKCHTQIQKLMLFKTHLLSLLRVKQTSQWLFNIPLCTCTEIYLGKNYWRHAWLKCIPVKLFTRKLKWVFSRNIHFLYLQHKLGQFAYIVANHKSCSRVLNRLES